MGMPKTAAAFTVYAGDECIPKGRIPDAMASLLWLLHADKELFELKRFHVFFGTFSLNIGNT